MFLPVGFSLLLFYKGVLCNQVTQSSPEQRVASGREVTLQCTFQTTYSNPDLYWYRKTPDAVFQFVLYRDNTRSRDADFARGRFTVQHSVRSKTFHLVISSVRPEDTATYYCALEHSTAREYYVRDTSKLTFGKGTRLIVEPKSQPAASPSVFVMKNGTNVACLVKEFYPKEVTISLQSSKKIIEYEPAIVVSPGGRYSAVKLGQYRDPDSVTCSVEHNKKTWHSSDFEPKKDISETTPKPTESENTTEIQVPATCYEPQVQPGKVNMMSLSVLGLRMLFAKSVAVNFLFTAKLFFF